MDQLIVHQLTEILAYQFFFVYSSAQTKYTWELIMCKSSSAVDPFFINVQDYRDKKDAVPRTTQNEDRKLSCQ